MKAFVALAVVCVLLPLVAGHGWVTDPKPRGYTGDQNGASTSGPCGAGTTYPQVVTLTTGDYLNVSWTIGGGHTGTAGPDTCRFSWSLTDNNATAFNNQILVDSIPCSAGNHAKYFAVNANSITSPSTAYLQFRWAAGDGGMWYNCIQMNISPVGVTIEDAEEGTQFGETVQPTETIYYRITADANKHLYVKLSATADTEFSLSGGYLPSDANDAQSWINAKANTEVGLSACSNEDSATTFYFAAYGGSSSLTFSATAESYDAMLFPAIEAPQVKSSLPEGGSKFYWTEGYTEGSTYRRVYAQKTSGKGWVRLWKSLTCTMDNTNAADEAESAWGEHGACIDLGTTEGRKYIQVESLNGTDIDFDLGVEEGQCEDKTFNGASAAQFSFMLLVAAVLAML